MRSTLMMILWTLTYIGIVTGYQDTILRPNYGVLMHRIGGTNAATTNWLHTFAVPWPKTPKQLHVNLPACGTPHGPICLNLQAIINQTVTRYNVTVNSIDNKIELVKSLIPAHIDPKLSQAKTKRSAPLAFLGNFANSLFGVATDSQTETISRHVAQIERGVKLAGQEIIKVENDLSSYVNTSNYRINNLVKGLEEVHNSVDIIAASTENKFKETLDTLTHMTLINE